MRTRWMMAVVVVLATAGAVGLAGPIQAQERPPENTTFVIRKVVTGPATAGSTVVVECESLSDGPGGVATELATLGFDAAGKPTTSSQEDFEVVGDAWVMTVSTPPDELDNPDCTATETVTGGAASTSWTCDFQFSAGVADPPIGCAADAGTGTGPVTATFGDTADEITTQTWTVVFTNTFPEAPVELEPAFTG